MDAPSQSIQALGDDKEGLSTLPTYQATSLALYKYPLQELTLGGYK